MQVFDILNSTDSYMGADPRDARFGLRVRDKKLESGAD